MRLTIKTIPRSTKIAILPQIDGSFLVRLTAPPTDNKANQQLIDVMSDHLHIPKTSLRIVRGHKSRHKTLEIPD